jgi:uncharacterized membrane protein
MISELIIWFHNILEALNQSTHRIIWNLFLALIPLILGIWLFRQSTCRSWLWWAGFLLFLAFLPNAPYILTDTIHLQELKAQDYSLSIFYLGIVPQYIFFVLVGFEAYTISLILWNKYLIKQGQQKYVLVSNLIIHLLCAFGIYLGRFERFNSWDLITQPGILINAVIERAIKPWQILSILITFIVLFALFWLTETINLAFISKVNIN